MAIQFTKEMHDTVVIMRKAKKDWDTIAGAILVSRPTLTKYCKEERIPTGRIPGIIRLTRRNQSCIAVTTDVWGNRRFVFRPWV